VVALRLGGALLPEREDRGRGGDESEHGQHRDGSAAESGCAALMAGGGGEKLPNPGTERDVVAVAPGPLAGGGPAFALVQQARGAAFVGPGGRGVDELLVKAQSAAVLGEPVTQPGPGADERLVGDLDGVIAEGEKACLGQLVEYFCGSGVLV